MVKAFQIQLSQLATDDQLRLDEKFAYFAIGQSWNVFEIKNRPFVKLKDIFERSYKNFEYEDGEQYKGIPTGTSYLDEDGQIVNWENVNLDDHPGRLKYKTERGDLLISSLKGAKVPAILIEEDLPNTVFSNGFYFFKVKSQFDEKFMLYILRTKKFRQVLDEHIYRGIGISTYREKDFLNIRIPLISKEKQEKAVVEIEKIEKEIKQLKLKFRKPQEIIDKVFAEEFDINFEFLLTKHNIKGFIADFYDFQRSNDLRFSAKHIYFSKILSQINIPLTKFKKYFTEQPLYGAAESAIDGVPNDDVRYVRITDVDDIGNLLDDEYKTAATIDNSYSLKNGDFLFARSGNTVGKSFLYNEKKHGRAIFAGYFIRFRFDHKKLDPLFLLYYSKSAIFNIWKNSIIRVMGQPNINAEEYKNLLIPDISLTRQDKIVSKIRTQLEAQEAKRAGIEQKRVEIEQIIEKVLQNSL